MAELAAIVLAAGRSRRMSSDVPKVLHDVLGIPLVEHVVRTARAVGVTRIVLVASPQHEAAVADALAAYPEVSVAVQTEPRGTAHAVLAARAALEGFQGDAFVLLGDAPCISPDSLEALVHEHRERAATVSVLSGVVDVPTGYGRIVRGPDGELAAIVEEKDLRAQENVDLLEAREINSGCFALALPAAWGVLERIQPSAATGELYVTDAVEGARAAGLRVHAVPAGRAEDVLGVNDRAQLAAVTATLRARINDGHLANGVTLVDPASAFIDARAQLEPDVRIEPFVVITGPCHLARGARVGPFAHLRAASLGPNAMVGNFVEVVRSEVGAGSRALHLTYLGDGQLGQDVNVGAGAVLANWDGERHSKCKVEDGASVGAGTILVAPSTLGRGAKTGAGAVVVKADVPAGATWVGVPARPLEGGRS